MPEPLLRTQRLTVKFAGLIAVDAVDLTVPRGGVHALIGPNGAGKTTLFNMISGLQAPSAGRVLLDGADVTALPPHRRARAGIARTFQAIRLFPEMTALETVLVGLHIAGGGRSEARAALDRVGLLPQAGTRAGALPYGHQRRLEIARAIASSPRLLLLDEPAAGMNPAETADLATLIRAIAADGSTVLLVEHDMGFVMRLADTVTVLCFGKMLFSGAPAAARQDAGVIEAYLGAKLARRLAS